MLDSITLVVAVAANGNVAAVSGGGGGGSGGGGGGDDDTIGAISVDADDAFGVGGTVNDVCGDNFSIPVTFSIRAVDDVAFGVSIGVIDVNVVAVDTAAAADDDDDDAPATAPATTGATTGDDNDIGINANPGVDGKEESSLRLPRAGIVSSC